MKNNQSYQYFLQFLALDLEVNPCISMDVRLERAYEFLQEEPIEFRKKIQEVVHEWRFESVSLSEAFKKRNEEFPMFGEVFERCDYKDQTKLSRALQDLSQFEWLYQ